MPFIFHNIHYISQSKWWTNSPQLHSLEFSLPSGSLSGWLLLWHHAKPPRATATLSTVELNLNKLPFPPSLQHNWNRLVFSERFWLNTKGNWKDVTVANTGSIKIANFPDTHFWLLDSQWKEHKACCSNLMLRKLSSSPQEAATKSISLEPSCVHTYGAGWESRVRCWGGRGSPCMSSSGRRTLISTRIAKPLAQTSCRETYQTSLSAWLPHGSPSVRKPVICLPIKLLLLVL